MKMMMMIRRGSLKLRVYFVLKVEGGKKEREREKRVKVVLERGFPRNLLVRRKKRKKVKKVTNLEFLLETLCIFFLFLFF